MTEYIDWEDIPYDPRYDLHILGYYGRWFDFNWGYILDEKHPRCYYCGKFVKVKWDRDWDGPCTDCYENTLFL